MARAVPIDHHCRFISDNPCVVAAWQGRDVAGPGDELGAVVHANGEAAAHVVLEVRRFAAGSAGDRLDVGRPAPAGLEDEPADLAAADLENLGAAVRELAGFVWPAKGLMLRSGSG